MSREAALLVLLAEAALVCGAVLLVGWLGTRKTK
jgi:hypothetical protein